MVNKLASSLGENAPRPHLTNRWPPLAKNPPRHACTRTRTGLQPVTLCTCMNNAHELKLIFFVVENHILALEGSILCRAMASGYGERMEA